MNPKINDTYWINIAKDVAEASTCRVKVGAVLSRNKLPVSFGFVGSISGDHHCYEKGCLYIDNFGAFGSGSGKSCIKTIHAEMNALLRATVRGNEREGWMECYCTHQPCLNCLKHLLQAGVRKIVFITPYKDEWREKFIEALHDDIKFEMYQYALKELNG